MNDEKEAPQGDGMPVGDLEEKTPEAARLPFFGIGLAVMFAAAAFFSGLEVGSDSRLDANILSIFSHKQAESSVDLGEFWNVWELLDEKFVSTTTTPPVATKERVYGAIEGLVNSLGDPYTVYMPPEDAEMFESDISGNFEGVGMEVGMRNNILTVIAPLPGTPAEKAGIHAGDAVLKINGKSTEGVSVDEAVKEIRGEKGTTVSFTIFREGEEEFLEIEVLRDTITIPTITSEVKDGVYVIHLFNFSAVSERLMQEELRAFYRSGYNKLVIDLRGNPGGYLESAVSMASFFLPVGKIIVRESFGGDIPEEVHRSIGRDLLAHKKFKLAVLVNGGSASASEILAGALKEHGVATVIGEQTFGKGSVQELIPLSDGSSLKVTIARWLTPNGVSISEGGLTPDIEVKLTQEDRTAGKDPQLEAAIKFLKD